MDTIRSARRSLQQILILVAGTAYGFLSPGTESPENAYRYDIFLDASLAEMRVQACFSGDWPEVLVAGSDHASRYLKNFGSSPGEPPARIEIDRNRIYLGEIKPRDCIDYVIDFERITGAFETPWRLLIDQRDAVSTPGQWLWLPEELPEPLIINFHLPEGLSVSAPWWMIGRTSDRISFQYENANPDWPGLVAIGRFSIRNLDVPGAQLRLAILHGTPDADEDKLTAWVRHGAEALTGIYGRFPLPVPQILVIPVGHNSDSAVPWGQVQRGGGTSAHLFVDHTRSLDELISDWTLVHELSHMIHPQLPADGRWLSEGLATYYQNVLQARAGVLAEREAWQKLHEGFERGRGETRPGVTPSSASKNMMRDREFMRVYWSGTAVYLLADWHLRRTGKGSLDLTLSRYQECCLPAARTWGARELMVKFDELSGSTIFTDLFDKYAESGHFPELKDVYAELGLQIEDGHIILNDDSDVAGIRSDIMRNKDSD
jgi:hypothetical protein